MADIKYLLWIKRYFPKDYVRLMKIKSPEKFYDDSYNFVVKKLEKITGGKITKFGGGLRFDYRGKDSEDPNVIIRYAQSLKGKKKLTLKDPKKRWKRKY